MQIRATPSRKVGLACSLRAARSASFGVALRKSAMNDVSRAAAAHSRRMRYASHVCDVYARSYAKYSGILMII